MQVFVLTGEHINRGTDEGYDTKVIGVYNTPFTAMIASDNYKNEHDDCVDTDIEEFVVI